MSKWVAKKNCFYVLGDVKKGEVAESVVFFKERNSNLVDVMVNGITHELFEETFMEGFEMIKEYGIKKNNYNLVLSRNKLNRIKYRGRNFGLKQYEVKELINHYEEKYRQLKEILNVKDQIIATFNNNVKLPKEVADWIVKRNFVSLLELETSLLEIIYRDITDSPIYSYLMHTEDALTNIIDAYRYGWEVE